MAICKPGRESSQETSPNSTWSGLWPPELWENKYLLLESSSCDLVIVAKLIRFLYLYSPVILGLYPISPFRHCCRWTYLAPNHFSKLVYGQSLFLLPPPVFNVSQVLNRISVDHLSFPIPPNSLSSPFLLFSPFADSSAHYFINSLNKALNCLIVGQRATSFDGYVLLAWTIGLWNSCFQEQGVPDMYKCFLLNTWKYSFLEGNGS